MTQSAICMMNLWINFGSQKRRLLAALLLVIAASAGAASYTVTNANDSGVGSLRQAITDANSNPGLDAIDFAIAGTAPFTINLLAGLPAISESVNLDATTQTGFSNKPVVVLNGSGVAAGVNGLTLNSAGNTIRGLVIKSFTKYGLEVLSVAAGSNTIQTCFIGTDVTGTVAQTNNFGGIHIGASSDNLIGGTNALEGNVISGNNNDGIWIEGQPVSARNQILGNWIGTTWGGTAALGNVQQGIRIIAGQFNAVGGGGTGARNIISGNGQSGVTIEGATSTNNVIRGNFVGLNDAGTAALANGQYGVRLLSGARFNTAGGANTGEGNVISGNLKSGVDLSSGAQNNTIQGNFIGTSKWGTNAVPNSESGVAMAAATNNLVGGTTAGARNVISGNAQAGIFVTGFSRSNRVEGNYIGVGVTGTNVVGNTGSGVLITNAVNNFIGSTATGGGNVISGNADSGIILRLATTTGNQILGNYIGTDSTGTRALSNSIWYGVLIDRAPANQIGGTATGAHNVISGNFDGIAIVGNTASNNVIQGNYIGSDYAGTAALGNLYQGIALMGTGPDIIYNTLIGGTNTGEGNLISANSSSPLYRPGIYLKYASGTRLQGNLLGVQADGVSPLGNLAHNLDLELATNTIIGGSSPSGGNVIANAIDSQRSGIRLRSGGGNSILGNSIYNNGRLGITMNGTVPTVNDTACDSDAGVNGLQNFPVLTNAVSDGVTTVIKGFLPSTAGQTYQLQFYASPTVNPSGYWEGKKFLGSTTVTLGASCTNSFIASLPSAAPTGWGVTATATDPGNNSSEFSAAVSLGSAPNLVIQPAAGPVTSISWLLTNSFGGTWQLMQATNLNSPILWVNVTNAPIVISNGTWFTVTLDATNDTRFFRLLYQ